MIATWWHETTTQKRIAIAHDWESIILDLSMSLNYSIK